MLALFVGCDSPRVKSKVCVVCRRKCVLIISQLALSLPPAQAAEQVRLYCDKLLEEVDEAQAAALRQAENDVSYREGSLRAMREEVSVWEVVDYFCLFDVSLSLKWASFCDISQVSISLMFILHLTARCPTFPLLSSLN